MRRLVHADGAVVVAMFAMRVVQAAVDEIVEMIAMANRDVAAVLAMGVTRGFAHFGRSATVRIIRRNLYHVFDVACSGRMLKAALGVEVVDVVTMANGGVAAVRAMMMFLR